MIPAFLAIWIVVEGFLLSPVVWAQSDLGSLKKGVVKVTAQFAKTRQIGTGFVAGQGKKHLFIVTASHVIEHVLEGDRWEIPTSIQVTFFTHQEDSFSAEVVQKEGGNPKGLALLKVGGEYPEDVQVLDWDMESQFHGGEEIQLIGFPMIGGAWAVTKGTLSGFHGPILKFSGAIGEGNSGGPLFYNGRVIGVVMEVNGQFGEAKPSQIAKFTVENWPGFTRQVLPLLLTPAPGSTSTGAGGVAGASSSRLASLVISTTPGGAQVFMDEELVGNTTEGSVVVEQLLPDAYDVMVKKSGFRPWTKSVELLPGERQELKAVLQKGAALTVTGVWKNPSEPTMSYVFQQTGEQVMMKEITTGILGTMVTAEGEGQVQGNHLELFYRTALGTMGHSTAIMSEDGQHLTGTFQDFSNMIPVALSLIRAADVPDPQTFSGNDAWKRLQELGR
ncbi:MAG: trypsin-like peptidase domain-containing protein [Nitrospirales bacterium]